MAVQNPDHTVFPNNQVFGTMLVLKRPEGDFKEQAFFMLFEHVQGGWLCNFSDEVGNKLGIETFGYTTKEAYESLLAQHRILNGGVDSTIVRKCKPVWDRYFNEDGDMFPTPVDGSEGLTDKVINDLSDFPYV